MARTAATAGQRKRKLSDADAGEAEAKSAKVAELKEKKQKKKTKKVALATADGEAATADLQRAKAKVKAKVVQQAGPKAKAKAKEKLNGNEAKSSKAKSSKESKKKQQQQQAPLTKKERRALKKQQKKNADLVSRLLTMWEELRVEATPAARVSELCDSALAAAKGKLCELAHSHDTARVLEAMLKRGTPQHRRQMFEELQEHVVPLSKSKYGKHVALKLAKYGDRRQRRQLLLRLEGKAPEMLKHRHASDLLEFAFNEFADAGQRASVLQEFYGPRLSVFKSDSVAGLADALAAVDKDGGGGGAAAEGRRAVVLSAARSHLLALARKDLLRHSLSHHLLHEYLTAAAAADCEEDEELLEALGQRLVPLLHTRAGAKAALLVLRRTDGAGLKRALRAMKTFVCTAAVNEHGYLCVLGLVELLHSAELLHKFVLRELFDSLPELLASQHGRKVLLYLLAPRDALYFPPQLLALLPCAGDKQQLSDRLQAALGLCSHGLLLHVASAMRQLCECSSSVLLVGEVLAKCPGDKSGCCSALVQLIRQPFAPSSDEQQQHIIERSASHIMLKRLLPACPQLLRQLHESVTDAELESWLACNRGCFFLLQLYDSCPGDCGLAERIAALGDKLRASSFKGAQLLAAKLKAG